MDRFTALVIIHLGPVLDGWLPLHGGQQQLPPPELQLLELVLGAGPGVELAHEVEGARRRGPLRPHHVIVRQHLRPELLVAERELLDAALPAVDVLDEVLEHGEPPRDLLLVVSQVQVSVQQPAASDDVSNSKTLKRTKLAKYKISHQQCHSSFHSTYVSE